MLHKLFHRGLPGSFEFDSVYAMQPMYTSGDNKRILTRLNTMNQFSMTRPTVPQPRVSVESHKAVCQMLQDQGSFESPWVSLRGNYISENAIDAYTSFVQDAKSSHLYRSPKAAKVYLDFLIGKAKSLVEGAAYRLGGTYNQIDFVRE